MSLFKALSGNPAGAVKDITEGLLKGADGLFTSADERLQHQAVLEKQVHVLVDNMVDSLAEHERELTTRHKLDMQSDSWLSKNIRPGTLVFLLTAVTLFAFTDGNLSWGDYVFVVKEAYISMYTDLLKLAFGFYFGARGVEKVAKIMASSRELERDTGVRKKKRGGWFGRRKNKDTDEE